MLMERKAKLGFGVPEIVSLVFGILAVAYLGLGIGLQALGADGEDREVGLIFAILGAGFAVATLILLGVSLRKRSIANRLLNQGRYVWGEVAQIECCYNMRVNGRHPYVLLVRHQDSLGNIHTFRSRPLPHYPDQSVVGRQVKIYYEEPDFRHYYLDVDGILPKVIEH